VPVSVLYPPPRITGFHCSSDDYLFTVSRLDGPKRIALLVEAMRHVKADIPLLIAGTGPDEEKSSPWLPAIIGSSSWAS
jgi:hypothetical protein